MNDFYTWLAQMAVQEGGIVIAPRPEHFRKMERDFLDKLRHVPAAIVNPPGTNPYSMALGKPGRWMMVWIPDDK